MTQNTAVVVRLVERGLIPDTIVRQGIRRLLRERIVELHGGETAKVAELTQQFFESMGRAGFAPPAEETEGQRFEVPAAFFGRVLGMHRKQSGCHWPEGTDSLTQAEAAALDATCARAGLADGQDVLELGCGWGALSLQMAERYPRSRITALSNSLSQREYIEAQAREWGLDNLRVVTCDFDVFETDERFDRVVSVEMFERLRNWPNAFAKVSRWLKSAGRFFMHVFTHREAPYVFAERDEGEWLSRHFFSGVMMPSEDLALHCQDDLRLLHRWRWDGTHYQRTSEAWLQNMDRQRAELMPLFAQTYGEDAGVCWTRWRLFFMSVAELFGYDDGQRWCVSHYLFEKRA